MQQAFYYKADNQTRIHVVDSTVHKYQNETVYNQYKIHHYQYSIYHYQYSIQHYQNTIHYYRNAARHYLSIIYPYRGTVHKLLVCTYFSDDKRLFHMLLLDIKRVCAEKGVGNPNAFMKGIGFNPWVITDILARRRVRLDYGQIEKLCLALRCTPNDLFEWQPTAGIDASHPMQGLVRGNKPGIPELLRGLSGEKLEQVRALMMELQNSGT